MELKEANSQELFPWVILNLVNPFNGIERHRLSATRRKRQHQRQESIQWNWKRLGVRYQWRRQASSNPFNGIERQLLGRTLLSTLRTESIQWNWKLWGKGARGGGNGCKESIQWNWKTIFSSNASYTSIGESIQWNWKISMFHCRLGSSVKLSESIQWNWKIILFFVMGSTNTFSCRNPFNGIERFINTIYGLSIVVKMCWIHSMELKVLSQFRATIATSSEDPFNGIESLRELDRSDWDARESVGLKGREKGECR